MRLTLDIFLLGTRAVLSTLFIFALSQSQAHAQNNSAQLSKKTIARCKVLESLPINESVVIRARVVAAGSTIPAYCDLLIQRRPSIHIALLLPLKQWNEKLIMMGCHGLCGQLATSADHVFSGFPSSPLSLLARGYAVTWSDSGHWGKDSTDGLWAQYNRQAEIDWGYRFIHATIEAAKDIINAFNKEDLRFTYFAGCGDGGRQALMAAQHYPDDFDGVLAGSPVLSPTSLYAVYYNRLLQAGLDETGQSIGLATKLPMLAAAVKSRCDPQDGHHDGIIAQPDRCDFDLAELSCDNKMDEPCLTEAERRGFEQIYDAPTNMLDKLIYPGGASLGSEENWAWFLNTDNAPSSSIENKNSPLETLLTRPPFALHQHFLRYLAFEFDPGVTYNILDFDIDRDLAEMVTIKSHIDVGEPDKLASFIRQGGRILIAHGWQDSIVPPSLSQDYIMRAYIQMEEAITNKGMRLYLVPGLGHCRSNNPTYSPPFLTMLEAWVEGNQTPDLVTLPLQSENEQKESSSLKETADPPNPIQLCPYPLRKKQASTQKNIVRCALSQDPLLMNTY